MIHKGEKLEKDAERLEREADNELDPEKRRRLRDLAADKRGQKRKWERPR